MPLLSRQNLQVHREHPPICKTLRILAPVTTDMLSQFRWLAKYVEGLEISLPDESDVRYGMGDDEKDWYLKPYLDPSEFIGMLPELLAMAANAVPNLKMLSVWHLSYCTGAVLASCACLTQITKLSLRGAELQQRRECPGTSVSQIQGLSRLQNLEVKSPNFSLCTPYVASHIILGLNGTPISMTASNRTLQYYSVFVFIIRAPHLEFT